MAGARALQHRRRRLRQARPRRARDGLGAARRRHARGALGRAPGARQPGRQPARRAWDRQGGPGRGRPAADAGDGRDLLRHLEARRDPALDVGALRRRRHPPPARGLRAEAAGHRRRQRAALRRLAGRRDRRARRGAARRSRGRARVRGHARRRPRPALLHVRHHREGEGHRPRPPLHPRPRGVHLLPRRPGGRALPRHGRVGLGRRDRAAARAVAARRRPVRLPARGRLRPGQAARLPLPQRGDERLHDADRDAVDDGAAATRGRRTRRGSGSSARPASRSTRRRSAGSASSTGSPCSTTTG